MNNSNFIAIDQLWSWLENSILKRFEFLVSKYGYQLSKVELVTSQCSIEYEKDDNRVGFWCSHGSRPEVFVKHGSKRIFTDELKKHLKITAQPPVKSSVFEVSCRKDDYEKLIEYYAEIIQVYLQQNSQI